jgi:hypothetical protein
MSSNNITLDNNLTAISFLLDTSGSMANIDTKELAQAANSLIKEQCEKGNKVVFYGAKFSDNFTLFSDGENGSNVNITADMITPEGATSLVPAFARMIRHMGSKLSDMTDVRPGNVIFILLSDGEQTMNFLRNKEPEDKPYEGTIGHLNLKTLVEEHQTTYNWKFFFLGTNFDTIKVGNKFGIDSKSCIDYHWSSQGASNVMRACSSAVTRSRDATFEGFTNAERSYSSQIDGHN